MTAGKGFEYLLSDVYGTFGAADGKHGHILSILIAYLFTGGTEEGDAVGIAGNHTVDVVIGIGSGRIAYNSDLLRHFDHFVECPFLVVDKRIKIAEIVLACHFLIEKNGGRADLREDRQIAGGEIDLVVEGERFGAVLGIPGSILIEILKRGKINKVILPCKAGKARERRHDKA